MPARSERWLPQGAEEITVHMRDGIRHFFTHRKPDKQTESAAGGQSALPCPILQPAQEEQLSQDLSVLALESHADSVRPLRAAEEEIKTAAAESLERLQVVRRGYCPVCGGHLSKRLFVSVCEQCGWNTFDVPRKGVRIHPFQKVESVEGEQCYVVKGGDVLLVRNEMVAERIPARGVERIEYLWDEGEIEQHHKQLVDRMTISCGWCNEEADPEKVGFHIVHIAFGTTQERYCFCSDECYEAFRKMYPARVHRNCYERDCKLCNLCIKRYDDEESTIRVLAKDYLKMNGRFRP
jgi:hypothetical protein